MRGLRAAGSIRANSPKLKYHRLGRWMFITIKIHVSSKRCNQGKKRDLAALIYGHVPSIRLGERNLQRNGEANQAAR